MNIIKILENIKLNAVYNEKLGNGSISRAELANLINSFADSAKVPRPTATVLDSDIAAIHKYKDGIIEFEEFVVLVI